MHHLLLIEDDQEISELLSRLLSSDGHQISQAFDGDTGLQKALEESFDLIILDIMLPGKDGLEVLKELRKHKSTPVLMLTARGDDIDRIIGLEMGADDYLPKPFNPRELQARLKAILRRVSLDQQSPENIEDIHYGPLTLSPQRREVCINHQPVALTSTEFTLTYYLLQHQGKAIDKNTLTQETLGRDLSRYDRAIDMHVSNVRRKLENALMIKTIRGIGYMVPLQETP